MKRGKEDEKVLGPMFPRLNVNDTEKGGPRAPPRNKMALYEQLTIPSQRYTAPPNQNNNGKPVTSTSTSLGPSNERNTYFPLHQPPSARSYDVQAHNAEASNSNNQLVHVENKKKPLEEDDYMVPVFSEARTETHNDISQNNLDGRGQIHLSLKNQELLPTTVGDGTNQSNFGMFVSKLQFKERGGSTLEISMGGTRGRDDMPWQNDASLPREHQEKHNLSSLENTGLCLLEERGDSLPAVDDMIDEGVHNLQREDQCEDNSLRLRLNRVFRGTNEINSGIDLEKENIDRGDDVSENSMVDSASEFDITPDDVVDMIGSNHFWKVRTAIVNQQRVFAVQVFELHRLLKVQKHFAGSPNLFLEATAYIGQASLKPSSTNNLSSEYVVKVLPLKGSIHKDAIPHRVTDDVEGTAENAVLKAPTTVLSRHHSIQPADYTSFSTNTALPPPGNMDPIMNPWGYHQPSAHQWLVPVMTPSEGLVYKPYPAPGFGGPVCGGCGPVGNFMNPPYQQGIGMPPPGIHFPGHGYFPPYGMPMMNSCVSGSTMDHFTPFQGPNPYSQMGQSEGASEHKRPRDQGSTASSHSDRALGIETIRVSEGRDANRVSAPPSTTEVLMDTPPREKQARVIRAVPHRSTSDSAARLFQSIQQELHESS